MNAFHFALADRLSRAMAGRYDYDGVENLGGLPVLHEDEDTQGGSRTGEQLRVDKILIVLYHNVQLVRLPNVSRALT